MTLVYLHLGSNVGRRKQHIDRSIEILSDRVGRVVRQSSYYETEAWGKKDQDDFVNLVLCMETRLDAWEVLENIQKIEKENGREKKIHWGPRKIDIDILFYGNEVINSDRLTIPHREIENRNFVLVPLMEIAGMYVHPVIGENIISLYAKCDDKSQVTIINDY